MESQPGVEHGTPGALVHFVETFSGYEEKLVQSVERQPTPDPVGISTAQLTGTPRPEEETIFVSDSNARPREFPQT